MMEVMLVHPEKPLSEIVREMIAELDRQLLCLLFLYSREERYLSYLFIAVASFIYLSKK